MTTTAIVLRDYQQTAVDIVLSAFRRGQRRQLLSLPPGSGKTVIFATVIERIGGRALVLAHRDELVQQAIDKLSMVAPHLRAGVVQGERNEVVDVDVIVASVPTLSQSHRLAQLPDDLAIVIADECHHAAAPTWRAVLAHLNAGETHGPALLGVTASPDRADGLGLDKLFGPKPAYALPLLDLIEAGHLSPLLAKRVHYRADFRLLESRGGDITAASAERAYLAGGGPQAVTKAVRQEAADRQHILVFAPGVLSAKETAQALAQAGIPAAWISGHSPLDERRDTIERFRTGAIRALVNCMILTEGADIPQVDCVVLARPTKSRALYLQMAGRGFRRHPAKTDTLLLDLTGNSGRHTLVSPASLVGLSPDDVEPGESLSAAAARKRQEEAASEVADVAIHSRTIDLFRRREAVWVATGDGRYALSCGNAGTIILRPETAQARHWSIVGSWPDGSVEVLRTHLTIDYAQSLGEAYAKQRGAAALIKRDAAWRKDPATPGQLNYMRVLGVEIPPGVTKGIAGELITAAKASRLRIGA